MKNMTTGNRILGIIVGILYIFFGFYAMSNPAATLITVSIFVSGVMIIGGASLIVSAYRAEEGNTKSGQMLEGILLLVLGLIFLFGNSNADIYILSYLLLFWFIASSAIQLQFALTIEKLWVKVIFILLNLFVLGYSIYFLFFPGLAAELLVVTIGILFITTGVNRIVVSA